MTKSWRQEKGEGAAGGSTAGFVAVAIAPSAYGVGEIKEVQVWYGLDMW